MRVKLGRDSRITIPAEVRKALGIKAGDDRLLDVQGGHIILMPEPADYARHLHGLHKEVWEGIDAQEYARRQRGAWE